MGVLYTATTPTLSLTFPNTVDLTTGTSFVVTISYPISEKRILEKSGADLDVQEHQIDVFLSQQDTLLMPKGNVLIQVNWLYMDGAIQRRVASVKREVFWDFNLKREVME